MREWTPAQKNAIDARKGNIIVSAAAGSGKTAVLVERVIKLLTSRENPIPADKLLVVTFTNAAAFEMKSRIQNALTLKAAENPNDSLILEQLSLLPSAKICTIDSFCINLVRENFYTLGISQDFNVMDGYTDEILQREVAEDIVSGYYSDDDNVEFLNLVELLSASKNDNALLDTVFSIHRYISAQPFPDEWLGDACELYNPDIDIDSSRVKKYVFSEIEYKLDIALKLIEDSLASLYQSDLLYEQYKSMLEKEKMTLNNLKNSLNKSWDEFRRDIFSVSFSTTPYKRNYTSDVKSKIVSNKSNCKSIVNECCALVKTDAQSFKRDNEKLFPLINLLCRIVREFDKTLIDRKDDLNKYTFSDIERFAMNLLFEKSDGGSVTPTPLALEYQNGYCEILVDEYQDTNAAQDALFEVLSNGSNRFMVGDVKQSIYRFRLAMPDIFNKKRDEYVDYVNGEDSEKSVNKKIILDKNFRSRKGICDYCNFLFSRLMSKKVGEMDYDEREYLNYTADYPDCEIPSASVKIVSCPSDYEGGSVEFEARSIALTIRRKVQSREQIKDGDGLRDIRYGDFAILLRSAKSSIPIFSKVFEQYNIPCFESGKGDLFDNNEVSLLMSLIRVIDNPIQDIPLLAVLMSPFYGYSADDISYARIKFGGGNLYSSVSKCSERFATFLDDLEIYRNAAASMSVEGLIRFILSRTSYLAVISAMGNAQIRRSNVMKFTEIAKNFDSGASVGLTAFVRYVDAIAESGCTVESDGNGANSDNCVSIMSVHGSKGLEFPVVILAGAHKKYNEFDLSSLTQFNSEWGIGLKVDNEELLCRYNSLQYSLIKNVNTYASMSENLRVLYVAVTRAKEQFISFHTYKDDGYISSVNNLSSKLCSSLITPLTVMKIHNDGDLILLCALFHKDGKILRDMCENPPKATAGEKFDFPLDIEIINSLDTVSENKTEILPPDDNMVEEMKKRLSFKYDRLSIGSFAAKRAASSLDDREKSYRYFAVSKPAFLNADDVTPAERGTAVHAFMQYCDFENCKKDTDAEIQRLCVEGLITEKQAEIIDRKKLNVFFNGSLASRIFESPNVYREMKVSSFVPVSMIEDTEFNDDVLVQGIADCVFEENGALVLVDYKTDIVKSDSQLLDMYKKQISFYAYAVEKTLGLPVKESVLYSFSLGRECIYK